MPGASRPTSRTTSIRRDAAQRRPLGDPQVEQRAQLRGGESRGLVGLCEQRVGDLSLGPVEADDALFDRPLRHHPVQRDRVLLPDAMSAIRGLGFSGGVPPPVEVIT